MNVSDMLDLIDESPYGVCAADAERGMVYCNSAAERILGYRGDEAAGLRRYEVCASLPPNGTATIRVEGCPSLIPAGRRIEPTVVNIRRAVPIRLPDRI